MKCPCCGSAKLIHDTRDMPYIHKGESTVILAVTGNFCPSCGEFVLNREHGDRYSELMGQFQRQVKLFKALERHPDLLNEIRMA